MSFYVGKHVSVYLLTKDVWYGTHNTVAPSFDFYSVTLSGQKRLSLAVEKNVGYGPQNSVVQ